MKRKRDEEDDKGGEDLTCFGGGGDSPEDVDACWLAQSSSSSTAAPSSVASSCSSGRSHPAVPAAAADSDIAAHQKGGSTSNDGLKIHKIFWQHHRQRDRLMMRLKRAESTLLRRTVCLTFSRRKKMRSKCLRWFGMFGTSLHPICCDRCGKHCF